MNLSLLTNFAKIKILRGHRSYSHDNAEKQEATVGVIIKPQLLHPVTIVNILSLNFITVI